MRVVGVATAVALATAMVLSRASGQAANTLTAAQRNAGWRLLFDGHSADQWRGYRSDSLPAGWRVEDGTLTKSGSADDIITRRPYGDFELDIDWKIAPGGNSGIFYHATEEYEKVYWSGPEFQLLDDAAAPDGANRLTAAGAAYAIYPSPAGIVKPAGQWNSTRIIVRGHHVEHWLNGTRLLAYDLGSADWTARVARSKFAPWHDYGRAALGYIGIQGDHDGALWLRNIRILGR